MYFLSARAEAQADFLKWVQREGIVLVDIIQTDITRIAELMSKYDDLPMDFADATLVVAAEKTGLREIISIDSDFDIYRLPGREHIRNVYKPK
jgi:predicted nucleic acid-binding protein